MVLRLVDEVVGQFENVGALVSVWPCWITCTTHVHEATFLAASVAEKSMIVLPCRNELVVVLTGMEAESLMRVDDDTPTLSNDLGDTHVYEMDVVPFSVSRVFAGHVTTGGSSVYYRGREGFIKYSKKINKRT